MKRTDVDLLELDTAALEPQLNLLLLLLDLNHLMSRERLQRKFSIKYTQLENSPEAGLQTARLAETDVK